MASIQLVTYRGTDAPFTGVLKNFRTSAKNSGHGVNFRTFQDNAQACISFSLFTGLISLPCSTLLLRHVE